MALSRTFRFLRTILLLLFGLSFFAFAVQRSTLNPHGLIERPFFLMAALPQFLGETLWNLTTGPFELSRAPDEFGATKGFAPLVNHTHHKIAGLVMRTAGSADAGQPGWRILYGIFHIDGAPRYAALALSPRFAIEHLWLITPEVLSESGTTFGQAQFPHGFALLRDGSIVAGFDNFYRTVRLDMCGRRAWTSQASLNHALYPVEGDRFAWGVGPDDNVQKIDLRDGKIVRTITIADLRAANPDISALEMKRVDDNMLGENGRNDPSGDYYPDAYHINDAEPLPAALAPVFPQFQTGDLLISVRSLNLVAVIDPQTARIKWLTNDYTLRQHDPDWEANGEISILDNQMGRQFSRILNIDPRTGAHRTVLDGRTLNFYTRIRGKHQALADGGMLVTSSEQGRIFEVGRDGRVRNEMLVRDPDHPGKNFVVSEAIILPPDDPLFERTRACSNH